MSISTALRSVIERFRSAIQSVFSSPTSDEIKPAKISVDIRDVDPGEDSTIPVEITFQSNPSYSGLSDKVFMGIEDAYEIQELDSGTVVRIEDGDKVATPESVLDFENPHAHGKLMEFRSKEVIPATEHGAVTLGVGFFPDGSDTRIPSEDFATDDVYIPT